MEETIQKSEKSKKPLIIFLAIISILSLTALGFMGYLYGKEMSAQGKNVFEIKNIDPTIANKLSGLITYSSEKLESADYFSPALQITLKYNEMLFTISESTSIVFFHPTDASLFTSAYLKISATTDIKGYYLEESYLTNLKFVEEIKDGDITTLLFSYEEPSLLNKDEKTTKTLSIITRPIEEQKTAYIEITNFNIKENEAIHTALKDVLKTISTDISDVEQNLEAQIASGLVTVKFDRSDWSILSQSENFLTLTGAQGSTAEVNFSISDVYNLDEVKDKDALRAQLTETLTNKENYSKENNTTFEILEDFETVQIDGVDFEKVITQTTYEWGSSNVQTYFIAFLEGPEKQINLITTYSPDKPEEKENITTLLKNITFNNEDVYSMAGDNVLGDASVTINKATILGQASTVRIFVRECNDVTFSSGLTGWVVAGKTYEICEAGMGSGFVVNGDGYIATNAHVANGNDFDSLATSGPYNETFMEDFLVDLESVIIENLGEIALFFATDEEMYSYFVSLLYDLDEQNFISYENTTRDLYIQGNDVYQLDEVTFELLNPSSHFKASLIDSNDISSMFQAMIKKETGYSDIADLALLKTDDPISIPSIPINSTTYSPGQEVYVIGYPGVADDKEFFSSTSVLSSTITKGTIGAIKPNANNSFDLLQIDASVEHGNSGGPIIDTEGNVIGVLTYGLSADLGNYNMGISGVELQRFLDSSALDLGINSERKELESALGDISLSYYSRAKEKLTGLVTNQDSLSIILQPFVDLCDSKIASGEDKTPLIDINGSLPMLIIFSLLILLLIVAVTMLIINLKAMKQKKANFIPMTNVAT